MLRMLCCGFSRWRLRDRLITPFAIDQTTQAQRVGVLQRRWRLAVRQVLIAHGAQEAVDGEGAHRGTTCVRGCRVWATVNHGLADLDTGRVAVEQNAPDFLFENRLQPVVLAQVRRLADHRRSQLTTQGLQRVFQLRIVSDFDQQRGRAEDFLLQQLITVQQQAHVSLEQLRLRLLAFLRLAGQMRHARMRQQMFHALAITAQATRVEHGLRSLTAHLFGQLLNECRERRGAQADDHAGVGTELTGTHDHRAGKLLGHGFTTCLQGAWQQHDRIDTGHLGKHRNGLWTLGSHFAQRVATVQRAGETNRLDGRVLDQAFTDAVAEDHVEHAFGHLRTLGSANDCAGHQIGSRHVTAVRLEYYRATGGQCCCGITARSGKRQREVACPKHSNRAHADAVLAQVDAWQRLAIRQRQVDTCTDEITAAQDLGKQTHLAAGAPALTLNTRLGQSGFLADDGDEVIAKPVEFISNGVEEIRATGRAQLTKFRECSLGSHCRGVDFAVGGLMKAVRQLFTRGGIQAFLQALAQSAAAASDEVLAENVRHRYLLLF
ncbi:hypothetical protein ALP24_05645 [Pseudomonas syringae pv. aptata]|uniref:Uncharacterized protein n=1 Tax=Pseudomonas syringae pv. aptata TaxID=83167 RepID=A0A3M5WNN5_PSEAP|nr:hypothetical protein ALP24_05645 [Pseudomonas syringae pv. aptata]